MELNKAQYISQQNMISISGRIEVICGPMKSGKTEELIRRILKIETSDKKCSIFKPKIDTRTENEIVSRSGFRLPAIPIDLNIFNIFSLIFPEENVICFDEAQFFGKEIIETTQKIKDQNKRVIISGLDMDYRKKPFGFMPELMAIADDVTKLRARCDVCSFENAVYTKRMTEDEEIIKIGDEDFYEVRCNECFII